jgi:molybdate transport system substrate-binding protein
MQQPRRLAEERGNRPVVMFTRNRMCLLARKDLDVTPADMLADMLDPKLRLATSTPGVDPAGDYAEVVFSRAEGRHPGAKAALDAKALRLVGGATTKPAISGYSAVAGIFLAEQADMMLGYCSGAAAVMREVAGLEAVPLPSEVTADPAYGMVLLSENDVAYRFAVFVVSERGQATLAHYNFLPVALPREGR